MNRVYKSKVDTWLGLLLTTLPIALTFVVWKILHAPVPGRWFIALLIIVIGICLPLSLLLFTRYTIRETHLLIRSGFITWKIPINEITKIEPSGDPISSPALSMDRLRLEYSSNRSILISPIRKEEFLSELKSLNVPHA